MRIALFLLLGSLGATAAHAQTTISFGPRLGGNLATGTLSPLDLSGSAVSPDLGLSHSPLLGYQLGVAASIGSGHWAFQPALLFTQKGGRQKAVGTFSPTTGTYNNYDIKVDSRINYLELPLNVVYGFEPDGEGWQVFAGPYVAVGVGGRADYTQVVTINYPGAPVTFTNSGNQQIAFGNTFASSDPNAPDADARVRRFDAGLNAGVGYRRGPVQVQLGYGLGLVNQQPAYEVSIPEYHPTGYHRGAQLTATYFLATAGR